MIQLVNMIPRSLSGETNQDSEPMITVNPANPQQIVGTAFTPDPFGGSQVPIYVSNDGGNTWVLNFIVTSEHATQDISVGFGSTSNNLYAGILRLPSLEPRMPRLNILRTRNALDPLPMK